MMIVLAVGVVSLAMLMMMGSTEEDYEWHVGAASRVLLCPSLMVLMGYAYMKKTKEIRGNEDAII